MSDSEKSASIVQKLLAALAYAVTSSVIMLVNKQVLTQYAFPSFLFIALLQAVVSVVVLLVQWTQLPVLGPGGRSEKAAQYRFPLLSMKCIRQVMPLPIVFVLNTASGLGATKQLNMPLFVLLRRFSIVMTLLLEMYLLQKSFSRNIKTSVFLMVLGAMITASVDVTYEWSGVFLILLNDIFTAAQGVGLRKKMDDIHQLSRLIVNHQTQELPPLDSFGATKRPPAPMGRQGASVGGPAIASSSDETLTPDLYLGAAGILYYNSLLSLPFILLLFLFHPVEFTNTWQFAGWGSSGPLFWLCLIASGGMGFILNYSYFWCTRVNSPLTTTVIGALKNILTTYAGMLFKDFRWNAVGFVGINVSVIGSLYYNKLEWDKMRHMEADRKLNVKAATLRDLEAGAPTSSQPEPHFEITALRDVAPQVADVVALKASRVTSPAGDDKGRLGLPPPPTMGGIKLSPQVSSAF